MRALEKIKIKLNKFENQPITIMRWLIIFSAIIIIRIFEESLLDLQKPQTTSFIWHDFIHIFLIFLFINLLGYYIFKKTLNLKLKNFLNISLVGTLFLSMIPPLINFLYSFKYHMIDFYEFYSLRELAINFFTFMQQDPLIGSLPGQRIVIFVTLIIVGIYSFVKSNKISISILNAFLFYIIFYIVSTLPSIITLIVSGLSSSAADVSSLFFAPNGLFNQPTLSIDIALHKKMIFTYIIIICILAIILFWKNKIFQNLLKNIRPIQTIYHLSLFFAGLGIALFFTEAYLIFNFFNIIALIILMLTIILIWYSSVIINDYFDENIDKVSNKKRPLIINIISKRDYLNLGISLIIIAIIISSLIDPTITILICIYYALTIIYNVPPLRLKKYLMVATFLASLASLVIVFIGYILIAPNNDLSEFPLEIIYFSIITLTISLPIKDLKDIRGDHLDNIYTIPVIFGEKIARLIIGVSIFISFILSIFILRANNLFGIALLFGALSFILITFKKNNKFLIKTNKVVPIIFSIVFLYGIYFVINIFK